jgi:ubiquinone/menaquinone biosynthesis C-methylase UbiE
VTTALSADDRRRLAATFGSVADLYERARPGYASAAIDWLLPPTARRVLDLAAGTGKLTAALVDRGLDVVAVEPAPEMLDRLVTRLPTVDARAGTAEHTGLPDNDVDAVLIAAALHWFERPAADHEIARVLRPGGTIGVFTNRRDTSVPWMHDLNELLTDRLVGWPRSPRSIESATFDPALFTAPERTEFPNPRMVDADGLVDMIATRSYVIDLPEPKRTALLDEVRHLARTHPDLVGQENFELPYVTVTVRSRRK